MPGVTKIDKPRSSPGAKQRVIACDQFFSHRGELSGVMPGSRPTISSEWARRARCSSRRKSLPAKVRTCSATVAPRTKPASPTDTAAADAGIHRPLRNATGSSIHSMDIIDG